MTLYAVTDRRWVGRQTLLEQVKSALEGGATCIQLREKELDDEDFLAEAMSVRRLCSDYGVPFIVNDNVDVALRSHADGVHVGQHDRPARDVRGAIGNSMILGVSVQTVEEALSAVSAGADYLGVGAVFPTLTKSDADYVPRDILAAICETVTIPVVAIGGIDRENLSLLTGTGVDGVALVSAIFSAEDIEAECRTLRVLAERLVGRRASQRSSKVTDACQMSEALSKAGSCEGGCLK